MLERFRLDGKIAIVTGAGRGIGAATARAMGEAGANVVLASRTAEQLEAVAADVRAFGGQALVIPTDVNENANIEALAHATIEEFGRIDIVVNNAGGTPPRPFLDTSPGYFERAFHFNTTTAFVLSKAAVPHMLEQGEGTIVNISSAIGRLRDRGFSAYGTAKAALSHLTRLMAADLAPKVRVNGIAVGSVEAGGEPDSRMGEAIELVRSKRQPDGAWLLENTHPGTVHFELEDGDRRPSRWNTLRALRVLRWHEQSGN